MRKIKIFGKNYMVIEQKSKRNLVQAKGNKIFIESYKKSAESLLKEYLSDCLYSELFNIYDGVRDDGKVDVFGNLDFEIVEKIDNKKQRLAKLDGNKILVKLSAVALPNSALKYMFAHEIAHIFTKRHTKRFWKIVEAICPNFKLGQNLLMKYESVLCNSFEDT